MDTVDGGVKSEDQGNSLHLERGGATAELRDTEETRASGRKLPFRFLKADNQVEYANVR